MAPAVPDGAIIEIQVGRPPERFDLVAYEKFWADGRAVVGRVIGLPGEVVEVKGPQLRINGKDIADPFVASPAAYDRTFRLDGEHYVVLQDQRNTGDDSHSRGPVPEGSILGSAPPASK
jgi:signal peptidase I